MKKYLTLLIPLFLMGCAVGEEVTPDGEEVVEAEETAPASFKLTAAQGYVDIDNYDIPHTYVIDSENNEVYVDKNIQGMTDEEREILTSMSDEAAEEYFANQPVVEESRYDATLLKVTEDEILIEYEDESLVFISLSESTYEAEDGTRYTIEEDMTIDDYLESFYE